MRRFYSIKTYPKDGETILYDGEEYTAHTKQGNDDCSKCCFHREYGCALDCLTLGCFDLMNDRRIYFTKGEKYGEEVDGEESQTCNEGVCRE